jgi:hypothetical protein
VASKIDRASVTRRKAELQDLLSNPRTVTGNEESEAHWAAYLCVLMAGYLETAVRGYLLAHSAERAEVTVQAFVSNRLGLFRNMSRDQLLGLVKMFSLEWGEEFRVFIAGEREDAVRSVVTNRHEIAHGQPSTVTLLQLRQWFGPLTEVIDALGDLCDREAAT